MIKLNPIAITATSQEYAVEVSEKLCQSYCLTSSVQPQGTMTFSVGQVKVSNGIAYVELMCNGSIIYRCGGCTSRVKQFSESVWLGFAGTAVPTIAVSAATPIQMADEVKCNNRASGWTMVSGVTVTATFPS